MQKKSMVIAMLLACISCGGFYAAGAKKGAILFVGLCIAGFILGKIMPELAFLVGIASFYITYQWTKEYNDAIDNGTAPTSPPAHTA